MVTVYTKPNCAHCKETKDLMKTLSVDYSEIDITKDPKALKFLKENGFREAPVVVTETEKWSGFKESKIRALTETSSDDTWDF
jgi:glutaredoxin-like protein NrdH